MKFSRLLLSDLFVETALASTSASLIMCSQIIYSWSAEQILINNTFIHYSIKSQNMHLIIHQAKVTHTHTQTCARDCITVGLLARLGLEHAILKIVLLVSLILASLYIPPRS